MPFIPDPNHRCASCSKPLGSYYYSDVPGIGDLCPGCWTEHFETVKATEEAFDAFEAATSGHLPPAPAYLLEPENCVDYQSKTDVVELTLYPACDCSLWPQKIGVAVQCRGCGGWRE